MNTEHASVYRNSTVRLDGRAFTGCTFENCVLIYSGGVLPELNNNRFFQCQWTFEDAASRTLSFITALYHSGGKDIVEATFETIRSGQPKEAEKARAG